MKSFAYLKKGEFAVIAHRGGSLEAPENTDTAFRHAFQVSDKIYFELDVHETQDGEIIVTHDQTVDRTTDGHGEVAQMTFAEITKLDAGYRFTLDHGKTFPFRGRGSKIIRLRDLLIEFSNTFLSVELKDGPRFFGHKVAQIIKETQSEDRICIAGEDHENLVKTSQLMPNVCSGFSAREMRLNFYCTLLHLPQFIGSTRGDVMQIPYSHNGRIIATPAFINRAHDQGKFIHVWTVNDQETMRHLLKIGVDGIITDAPTLLTRVLLNS